MEILQDNPEENTQPTFSPLSKAGARSLNEKDINLTLTPLETDILVTVLYFYESAMYDNLSSEDIDQLQGIYDKIGVLTEYKLN